MSDWPAEEARRLAIGIQASAAAAVGKSVSTFDGARPDWERFIVFFLREAVRRGMREGRQQALNSVADVYEITAESARRSAYETSNAGMGTPESVCAADELDAQAAVYRREAQRLRALAEERKEGE